MNFFICLVFVFSEKFLGIAWIIGVNLKMGIAYATTDIPLTNRAMKKALLLPFWMTGFFHVHWFYYRNAGASSV